MRKQQSQILGPAIAELAVVAVHAGADGVGGVAEANLAAGTFHGSGEGYVFENVSCNCSMTADCVVGFAADEDELAVRGGDARGRIADNRRRILPGQFRE